MYIISILNSLLPTIDQIDLYMHLPYSKLKCKTTQLLTILARVLMCVD